jgi:hypothetical protein
MGCCIAPTADGNACCGVKGGDNVHVLATLITGCKWRVVIAALGTAATVKGGVDTYSNVKGGCKGHHEGYSRCNGGVTTRCTGVQ